MTPQELEACVLAGLLNGGATPDAFDVLAGTPDEAFCTVFYRRTCHGSEPKGIRGENGQSVAQSQGSPPATGER